MRTAWLSLALAGLLLAVPTASAGPRVYGQQTVDCDALDLGLYFPCTLKVEHWVEKRSCTLTGCTFVHDCRIHLRGEDAEATALCGSASMSAEVDTTGTAGDYALDGSFFVLLGSCRSFVVSGDAQSYATVPHPLLASPTASHTLTVCA